MYTTCAAPVTIHFKVLKYDFKTKNPVALVIPKKCRQCPFRAISNLLLLRHVSVVHHRTYKGLQCEFCVRVCNTNQDLRRHIETQHLVSPQKFWLRCQICDYKTPHNRNLQIHIVGKHLNEEEKSAKWHKCAHCDYRTWSKSYIKVHVERKHLAVTDAWLTCDHCDYTTTVLINLRKHIQRRHTATKEYRKVQCGVCKCFVDRSNIRRHILAIHGDKTKCEKGWHICRFCDYKSACVSSLKKHIVRRHTSDADIAWVQCTICESRFKFKADLNRHMQKVHKLKKDTALKCDQCGSTFTDKASLKTHVFPRPVCEAGVLSDYTNVQKGDCHESIVKQDIL